MLRRALEARSDGRLPPVKWMCKSIVYSEPEDIVEEFHELVDGNTPEWAEFDLVLLDVHWGKQHPMGGFDIYKELKMHYDREVVAGARTRLPWRFPPVVSTLYAGSADNDPSLLKVYNLAANMSIPRDQVMQMVVYDDAVKIADKSSQILRGDPPPW
jgi:hypothetical protein